MKGSQQEICNHPLPCQRHLIPRGVRESFDGSHGTLPLSGVWKGHIYKQHEMWDCGAGLKNKTPLPLSSWDTSIPTPQGLGDWTASSLGSKCWFSSFYLSEYFQLMVKTIFKCQICMLVSFIRCPFLFNCHKIHVQRSIKVLFTCQ